ncbi:MAG: hypothetical protein E4H40_05395, partial [Candidatus Brocadiia bacterium]
MSKMVKLFVLICICLTGLSGLVLAAQSPLLSNLPAAVQKVANSELAGARITKVNGDDDYDGINVYKIEAETADGKELMIKVAPDGTLYQKEVEIGFGDVPKVVSATFNKELNNAAADVDEVKRISKQGKVQYNIEAKVGGKDIELKIAADGAILEKDGGKDSNQDGKNDGNGGGVIAGILYDSMDFTNPRSGLDI